MELIERERKGADLYWDERWYTGMGTGSGSAAAICCSLVTVP